MSQEESHSNKTELIEQLDEIITQIKQAELDPGVILYTELRSQAEAITNQLKEFAMQDGPFQSKFVAFQRVKQVIVDWKAVCENLYRSKRIKDEDVLPYQVEKQITRAVKIKEGKGDMEINS